MTIKQQGGIFGRNPTFNDVDVEGSLTAGPITGTTLTATGAFTSLGIDDNAPSTAVTITSSNKVGINTTSPSYPLVVSDGGASGIEFVPGAAAGLSQIIAINRSGGTYDTLRLNALNHSFNTSGSTRMTIDASGHAIIPQGVTLGTSAGVYNAANTIDDYEEGTWTPSVSATSGSFTTVTISNAEYVKIGKTVHVSAKFVITTIGTGSGNMTISGLPYSLDASQGGVQIMGRISNSGELCFGQVSTTSISLFRKYDKTSAIVGGYSYLLQGQYQTES